MSLFQNPLPRGPATPPMTAANVLARYWDGKIPVDVEAIARRMGIAVVEHNFSDDTVCEQVILKGVRTIRIATNTGALRRRFAIAHSLGHFALGHSLPT